MAAVILLDTHVVVWLYEDPQRLIPTPVRQRLEEEPLALSPFVRLELEYLSEVGKLSVPPQTIVDELTPKLELALTDPPAALVCQAALGLSWTRDPFDRLLSAQALATATPLVTKDRTIREHLSLAWWAG
jgi:PIN domain nuclease of toxin-antitoxin system